MNRLPVHHKAFNILYFFSFNFTPTEISILDKFSGVLSRPLMVEEPCSTLAVIKFPMHNERRTKGEADFFSAKS